MVPPVVKGHGDGLLLLTQVTGQTVFEPNGRVVGRLADLSVDLDSHAGPPLVQRLLVRRRRSPDLLLPWAMIENFEHSGVVIGGGVNPANFVITSITDALGGDEILLWRDVLDTQIVDVVGQRLARVADVILSRTAGGRLELVGAEVGFGGVLRRLGLARLATRIHQDIVAWTELHLTSERGHAVQLATPRSAVHHLHATDLAALINRLDIDSAADILAATGPRVAAGVVRTADPAIGERALRAMSDEDATNILAAMPSEHATLWRTRLAHTPALLGRRFLRSRVWPRRHLRRTGAAP